MVATAAQVLTNAPIDQSNAINSDAAMWREGPLKRFAIGSLTGAVALTLGVFVYLVFGFADFRADARAPAWLYSATQASIRRAAPRLKNPLSPSDEILIAGGKLYLNDCVGCHGAPGQPVSDFAATFYPPAPQLARSGTQYSEAEIYWIAKHGIGRTGMAGQGLSYSDQKLWSMAAFIRRITELPPRVAAGIQENAVK